MLLRRTRVVFLAQLCVAGFLLSLFLPESAWTDEALWIEGEDPNFRTSTDFIETWMAGPWYHHSGLDMTLLSPGVPGRLKWQLAFDLPR